VDRGGSRESFVRAPSGKHPENGAWCVTHGAAKGWRRLPRAQRRFPQSIHVLEDFHHFFYAASGAGDLGSVLAFLVRH